MSSIVHIGFDDTDSILGGCTTYLATKIVIELARFNADFLDFPNLVRLNPNIPYKTRGNGSVALRIRIDQNQWPSIKKRILNIIQRESRLSEPNVNPGLVFVIGTVPEEVTKFSLDALTTVIDKERALNLLKLFSFEYYQWNSGQGLVGALAAIGYPFALQDHTFELLAYRQSLATGKRQIDVESVFRADNIFQDTFSNIDRINGRIMMIPHGPDPVFVGIRGETPNDVLEFWKNIRPLEVIKTLMIFRTNQGTNAHLPLNTTLITHLRPYESVRIEGTITHAPEIIEGGHVVFSVADATGTLPCYVYEPTKQFRKEVLQLVQNDILVLFGGIRPPENGYELCLNVEQIILKQLAVAKRYRNPSCSQCNKSLTSKGVNKGYFCKKCHVVFRELTKEEILLPRNLHESQILLPPSCAHRHLTKPWVRYGKEKHEMHPYDYSTFIHRLLTDKL